MTPQDMADYKMRWMMRGPHKVRVHSDLHIETKDWCRRNLQRQSWSFDNFTGAYEHTFLFENRDDADRFSKEFQNAIYGDDDD